jgi:hypothetical protein
MVPNYDVYEFDPLESHGEEEEEPKMQFTSFLEPVSEQSSFEISQPTSASHSPKLSIDIHLCVISYQT